MNFTYLFGAGASCKVLPMVNGLPPDFRDMANKLNTIYRLSDENFIQLRGHNKAKVQDWLINDLNNFADQADRLTSIDTFAKKLYLNDNQDVLNQLKATLSAFMALKEAENGTDYRYSAFYASLLQRHVSDFPSNVQILSWNYDNQFERSYFDFSNGRILPNIYRKYRKTEREKEAFGIFQINGATGYTWNDNSNFFPMHRTTPTLNLALVDQVVESYGHITTQQSCQSGISFGWERDNEIVKQVFEATQETEILVVIGYSFPYFNREIDKKILANMNLRKIYFQSPEALKLKDRVKGIINTNDIEIVPIHEDMNQFFLPYEL